VYLSPYCGLSVYKILCLGKRVMTSVFNICRLGDAVVSGPRKTRRLCKRQLTAVKPFRASLTGFTQGPAVSAPTWWAKVSRHERSSGPPPMDRHERTGCTHRFASRHRPEFDARHPSSSPPDGSAESTEALPAVDIHDARRCLDVQPRLCELRMDTVCTPAAWRRTV